jgi:hypothetical protein
MMTRDRFKQFILTRFPRTGRLVQREWRRRFVRRFEKEEGLHRITAEFLRKYGARVNGGPFAGMLYIHRATGSVLTPKLVGSYESELHSILETLASRDYTRIIDIGCAEGYYAVGMARRFPEARVYAFDTDPFARNMCRRMAQLNDVSDRVEVRSGADFAVLGEVVGDRSLVICDCDGCEAYLLDPRECPCLLRADLLIELHDHFDATISPTLLANFATSHDIVTVDSVERDPKDWPVVGFLCEEDQHKALGEYRPPQRWFFMTPKRSTETASQLSTISTEI